MEIIQPFAAPIFKIEAEVVTILGTKLPFIF
ncbi:uncharacterized protein G2W53_004961 [Senna tora]|uniref:Uncharacterized protein n=1 Tax=Senna tora TaxID=362788 RepID=A0A834XC26_9FABA|nr:uncharacterized protein G2W53_004961 [Senna tora]